MTFEEIARAFAFATTIVAEGAESLQDYASISIAFETSERVIKDYDTIPGNSPRDWPARFDISRWTFLAAYRSGVRVGGAVVLAEDPAVEVLAGRTDVALLWDLRVAAEARGRGIGSSLLCVAQSWAWARGCSTLEVETQDINVAACRLYARHGFRLSATDPHAYPDQPGEVQLLWSAALAGMAD
jgi:GNAT superfamily N-acetyltransferase